MELSYHTKSSQLTLKAWNYLGRHGKTFILLAFCPWLVETVVEYYYMGLNNLDESFFISPLNKILQPFWAILWMQCILKDNFSLNIKEYFNFNKKHFLYLIFILGICLPFNLIELIMTKFNVNDWIDTAFLIVWTLLSTSILIIFPSIADNKPISISAAFKATKPFWVSFIKSTGFAIILIFLSIAITVISVTNLIYLLEWNLHPILKVAGNNLLSLFSDGLLITLTTLYYKKYVMKKELKGL